MAKKKSRNAKSKRPAKKLGKHPRGPSEKDKKSKVKKLMRLAKSRHKRKGKK